MAANSRPFKNPSPVTELAHGSVLTVGQLSESLLRYMGRHGGWSREPGNLLLDMLLGGGADRKLPKAQACGLNSNGMPVQLCVSARRGSTAMVLIGDPWADIEDPRVRQSESVVCAWRLLAHTGCEALRTALQATLTIMLPSSAAEADTVLRGVLWLGAGVRKPSFSLYACPTWDGNMQTGWLRVERWLNEILPDPAPALRVVEQIRPIASPECACIEGTAPGSGRAKVYFRLLRAVAPNALRLLGLDNAGVDTFLQTAVESRALRLQAMVYGVSFCLNTGTFVDAKLDLCGHCLPRRRESWQSVLSHVGEQLEIDTTDAVAMLTEEGIELACIGIGRDRLGAFRLNTYGRPVRPMAGTQSSVIHDASVMES